MPKRNIERGRPLNKYPVFLYNYDRKQLMRFKTHHGEFDPGSEGTLAACITHASRTRKDPSGFGRVANG